MFKWSTLLQLLFVLHLYVEKVNSKRTINVGTVLFDISDTKKDCWTFEGVFLLKSRTLMQMILPNEYDSDYEKSKGDTFIHYLYSTLNAVRSFAKGSAQQAMVLALSDVVGGYMRSQLLPTARKEYYQGNIPYSEAERLYMLYNHLKSILRTDGDGWTEPQKLDVKLNELPSLKISANGTSKGVCDHLNVVRSSEKHSAITIPMPHLNNDKEPPSIAVPFRRQNPLSLQAASSAFIVQKYYVDGMQCLLATANKEGVMHFNAELDAWLKKSVMPLLDDEEWYPAFGGVYRVLATILRVRALQYSRSSDKRAQFALVRNGDTFIPNLSGYPLHSTEPAVALMQRLPILQHPAFVASLPYEQAPAKPENDQTYLNPSERNETSSDRASLKHSSELENNQVISTSVSLHENKQSYEFVHGKQPNLLLDPHSSDALNGQASVTVPNIQVSPIFPAYSETLALPFRLHTISPEPLSSYLPLSVKKHVSKESKVTSNVCPSNRTTNSLAHDKSHLSEKKSYLRSFPTKSTFVPPRNTSNVLAYGSLITSDKSFKKRVKPYIVKHLPPLSISRTTTVMSSTLPNIYLKNPFGNESRDAKVTVVSSVSPSLVGEELQSNLAKTSLTHYLPISSSFLFSTPKKTGDQSLSNSPLNSYNVSSTIDIKGGTFISVPSALTMFLGLSTSFLPYSPLPTSSYPENVPSKSDENLDSLLTDSIVDKKYQHSFVENLSAFGPVQSKLTHLPSSTELLSHKNVLISVPRAKPNISEYTFEINNHPQFQVNANSATFPVSLSSYDDRNSRIMNTPHSKCHKSKVHRKSRFRFLKPHHYSNPPFAKSGIVPSSHKRSDPSESLKNVTSFIRSDVKSATVDQSLRITIPNILPAPPRLLNYPRSQYLTDNDMSIKNALISNNRDEIDSDSDSNTFIYHSLNFPIGNSVNLFPNNESLKSSDKTTAETTWTEIRAFSENTVIDATNKNFGLKNNSTFELSEWKRNALKDSFTFPVNSQFDKRITSITYASPDRSVVTSKSENVFLLPTILPPVTDVGNPEIGKQVPDFLSLDLSINAKNPEHVFVNDEVQNIPSISSDELNTFTEKLTFPQDHKQINEVPEIKFILKNLHSSEEVSQSKKRMEWSHLSSEMDLGDESTEQPTSLGKEYNNTLVSLEDAIDIADNIRPEINRLTDRTAMKSFASPKRGGKKKSNSILNMIVRFSNKTNSPREQFLQMELEENEENNRINDRTKWQQGSRSQLGKYDEVNNNIRHNVVKYKNLLTVPQKRLMKEDKLQEFTEHIKGNNTRTEANRGSKVVSLNEKIYDTVDASYHKNKNKFLTRLTNAKLEKYVTLPRKSTQGNENDKYTTEGIITTNHDRKIDEDDYDDDDYYDDDDEKERTPAADVAAIGRTKWKISGSYTVKSVYMEEPRRTAPRYPFIDTIMEKGLKHVMSSLIISPDLGILNVILTVVLWIILSLCRCVVEKCSDTGGADTTHQPNRRTQKLYPLRKVKSSLSSFRKIVPLRSGPRSNLSAIPSNKLHDMQQPKGLSDTPEADTPWICECPPSKEGPCLNSVMRAEGGIDLGSIRDEFSDDPEVLRQLDEALDVIRAANTILSKPHSCSHLTPQPHQSLPQSSRSIPLIPSRQSSRSELSQNDSPYQSWLYRETYWPKNPPWTDVEQGYSLEVEREPYLQEERCSLETSAERAFCKPSKTICGSPDFSSTHAHEEAKRSRSEKRWEHSVQERKCEECGSFISSQSSYSSG